MLIIWWIRRDIRLDDNAALLEAVAASDGHVLPCFVLDERLLRSARSGAARVHFMLESLRSLEADLRARGSALVLRRGDPLEVLPTLVRESHADAVYFNRDYSPYATRRDAALTKALEKAGCAVRSFKDAVIWEPGEITSNQGKPYSVYTPYWRRWWALVQEGAWQPTLGSPPAFSSPTQLDTLAVPSADDLGFNLAQKVQPAGEAAGQKLLRAFADAGKQPPITSYAALRDLPAEQGTSRLSPHLRLGTIAPGRCLAVALEAYQQATSDEERLGPRTWIGELAWRDFYVQILAAYPHVLQGAFKREYDSLQWGNDAAYLAAWQEGRTGYPIVDAAMRQLNQEAWMHNRLRMITASFLTKDLLVDWRLGELYFMQQLACGCPAANNGGWQWAAGTGTDAQPYFRIFNPTAQGQKFDPEGHFVRRYLPELAQVPNSFIHEPWKMSEALQRQSGLRLGHDYPRPIVDHQAQRARALALYKRTS